jgi:hypothetical protein
MTSAPRLAPPSSARASTEILPFLEEGSAGIDRLSKDAHKYGGVLSAEAIKNADLADKAMRDAEMAFGGVTNTLGAELLPTVTRVFREFSGWVASNRDADQGVGGERTAKWIETKGIPAFKHIAGEVKSFAEKMLYLVEGAAKLTGGFDNLALVLVGLRLAPKGSHAKRWRRGSIRRRSWDSTPTTSERRISDG